MERVAPKSKHRKEGARKKIFRMLLEPISAVGDRRVVQMRGRGPRSVLSHMSGPMTKQMRRPVIAYYCRCLVVSRIRVLVEKSCISMGRFLRGTSALAASRWPPAEPSALNIFSASRPAFFL